MGFLANMSAMAQDAPWIKNMVAAEPKERDPLLFGYALGEEGQDGI